MEKFKNLFKDKNKKVENLVVFLIILVITLIIINNIIKEDENPSTNQYTNAELAKVEPDNSSTDLEKRLENILSKIDGVSDVSVLITYSESSTLVPIYNESSSSSVTEETDTSGGVKTTESEDIEKNVVTGSDSNPITGKTISPTIEGAIVTAKGISNSSVKANIISAVEAVTGIATHKIQVFERGGD